MSRAVITINYKAHIPAGVAFAGGLSMIAGWPVVVPVLIGGAIGGALPDIDIEGSAIEKMGDKTASAVDKTIGRHVGKRASGILSIAGKGIDMVFLAPIARLWRFLSKKVFGNLYLKLYNLGSFGPDRQTLGQKLHWNGDNKPWAHRGGITHSISFMITSCVLTVPVAFIFQSPEFLIGAEAGIASHLFADSLCKSGVKYFFPFQPKVGFDNDNGAGRGRDVRLLPKGMQVVTGKDRITNTELEGYADQAKALKDRKLRNRERLWQWIFKLLALAAIVLLLLGVIGPGGIAMSALGKDFSEASSPIAVVADAVDGSSGSAAGGNGGSGGDSASGGKAAAFDQTSDSDATGNKEGTVTTTTETIDLSSNTGSGNGSGSCENAGGSGSDSGISADGTVAATGDVALMGASLSGADKIDVRGSNVNSKPEIRGVTSLTLGDIDVKELPRGVVKMPDESLWIIGVGPVTRDNLNNSLWQFTDVEKAKLMAAAGAQRLDGIPTSISNVFTDSAAFLGDTAKDVADAAGNAAGSAGNAASEGAGGIMGWLSDITGVDLTGSGSGGGYKGGFLGITTWTDT